MKPDPDFTMADLKAAGERFIEAGHAYWEAAHRAGIRGAVIWLEDTQKGLVIFTRGEYREWLLRNIHEVGPSRSFGAATDE